MPTYNVIMERITRTCLAIVMNTHAKLLISSPLMGTTSPPADIVTGEHLAGAHKQIELEISPGPLISAFGTGCQFPDSGEPEGRPGRADMARRPARPQDGHYSIEFE